ncbi:MAG: sugar-binding protein, partial [Ktedonobacteraceae bacterium]
GLNCMDVVSDHPYTALYLASPEVQGLEEDMQNLQQLIQRDNHGQTKPIWITEMGWTTANLYVSEQTQANYLVRGMILGLAAGVQKIFWYDLLNDGSDNAVVQQNFGLLRVPDQEKLYTPKPAYTAYAVLVHELAGRQFLRRASVTPGVFDMLFSSNLHVLWTTLLKKNIVLTTDHPVTAISLTGRVQTLQPVGGKIMLSLSGEPVYIQGTISGVSSDD